MKLAQISTIRDMLAWAKAEYADAQRYCNKTATLAIYSQTVAYLQSVTSMIGTSSESDYVNTAKNMLNNARSQWYKDGCAAPGSSSGSAAEAPSDETSGGADETEVTGASSWTTWLLAGAGLAALWYLFGRGKPGAKGTKRKTLPRKTTRRRRRR